MKNQLLHLAAIALLFFSCEKQENSNLSPTDSAKPTENVAKAGKPTRPPVIVPPSLVWSAASEPAPGTMGPAIFYSPHQDDESLGMGASIAEHVRVGRPVYVVLMTKGENSGMLTYMQNQPGYGNSTMQDVVNARNAEFLAACQTLGVHRVYISNLGNGFAETTTLANQIQNFKGTMAYMDGQFPIASHKTVSGNCDAYNYSCAKMPAHQACASAMDDLYNAGAFTDIRLYRLYNFWNTANNYAHYCHPADWNKWINPLDKATRAAAFYEYEYQDFANGRFGLGYNVSVQGLFDAIEPHNYEYVDYIWSNADCE